jgi:CubicO group peptidase (beta-lactamase class C family)
MRALELTAAWPVPHVAAATVIADEVTTIGPTDRLFRIASIAKPLTTWAALVAVEEGIVALDQPVGQPGCTLRHLLAHAGGYGFDGAEPLARPGSRRIYSKTGIEHAAATVERAAGMPFGDYLHEAVLAPLGMDATALRGSPAHAVWSTVDDLLSFVGELRHPRLVSSATARESSTTQFEGLAGIVPGLGRFDPCPWGLGIEVRGHKQPHWTGLRNSPATFGHFGGAGTFLWVDPDADVACIALTDRAFDEWAGEALRLWPQLSDAVLTEAVDGAIRA